MLEDFVDQLIIYTLARDSILRAYSLLPTFNLHEDHLVSLWCPTFAISEELVASIANLIMSRRRSRQQSGEMLIMEANIFTTTVILPQ